MFKRESKKFNQLIRCEVQINNLLYRFTYEVMNKMHSLDY